MDWSTGDCCLLSLALGGWPKPVSQDKYIGCLLCGAIGDAIGARFEWQSHRQIFQAYFRSGEIFDGSDTSSEFYYSDDTQSIISVTEALLAEEEVSPQNIFLNIVKNYEPWRGYGHGFRKLVAAYNDGVPISELATHHFGDGSYGNGGAMRIAPIALRYSRNRDARGRAVQESTRITHSHPDAIIGAEILAHAIAYCVSTTVFDRDSFFAAVSSAAVTAEYQSEIEKARLASCLDDIIDIGSDIDALHSVPAALACMSLSPHDISACIGMAIHIGGDTDTVASMAGNMFGALNGPSQIPSRMLAALDRDNSPKGAGYIRRLAIRLHAASQA